jgi:hypothetical protein
MTDGLDLLVLITGTPRSGKSTLAKIMKTAPEFAYFREPLNLWSVVPFARDHDRLDESDARDSVATQLVARCSKAVAAEGKRRYLDDFSYHSLAVPFIHRVFSKARIIHVVRDPIEAIPEMASAWTYKHKLSETIYDRRKVLNLRSIRQHGVRFVKNYLRSRLTGRRHSFGPRVPGMKAFAAEHSIAEVAAFQWERMVRIARGDLRKLPAECWLEVRFERLIDDTANECRRIAEFAQVDGVDSLVNYATGFVEPDRAAEKRLEPTMQEWERIWARIADLASELGYPPRFRAYGSSRR